MAGADFRDAMFIAVHGTPGSPGCAADQPNKPKAAHACGVQSCAIVEEGIVKRSRIPIVVAVILAVVGLGIIGVVVVDRLQQLNVTPTDPPAARAIITSAPPPADQATAEQWGELFRQHAAQANYTPDDSADLTGDWRVAAEEVTMISGDQVSQRVTIRTGLEPGDVAAARLVATVFTLWQGGDPARSALAPRGAEWSDHGVFSVYAADDTILIPNSTF
ncbi:hypothetical protein PJ985_11930 [Streptomyces sp. ACA25]|uniref:hypothetical protein n=1 Tax=Streptomyces sp. ACA25 TaxID=3022596 RepID=UPI002307BA0E|nr:hypothetical protein [Streptomyces sp. ACA25]MDB1088273.1 hypothetical protein [Streptomyces sp. ACA25]